MSITPSLVGILASTSVISGVTWNALDKGSNVTLSNGNKTASGTSTSFNIVRATTSHSSGKYYFEGTKDSISAGYPYLGIGNSSIAFNNALGFGSAGVFSSSGNNNSSYKNGGYVTNGITWATNDVINVAVDLTALKIWFGKNGTWMLSGNPGAGTNPTFSALTSDTYFPILCVDGGAGTATLTARFTSGSWGYSAPAGFGAW